MSVRAAMPADLSRIVELCEAERQTYSAGHASFYAVAADYAEKKKASVAGLLDGDQGIVFVHETDGRVDGVVVGIVVNAPPVYDPGGKVGLIEDFVMPTPAEGAGLLSAAGDRVHELGGVLLVAECMRAAVTKRELLLSTGFSVASDWYCRDIHLTEPGPPINGIIEPAVLDDLPAIIEICERRRLQYQEYQPVFWRRAADSAEKHGGFLYWMTTNGKAIVLVHRSAGTIDGFIVADPFAASPYYDRKGTSCNVDDFGVAGDTLWPVGARLLYEATAIAKPKGAVCTQVISGDGDLAKRRMLEQMGYELGHEWLVRSS